MAAYLDSEDLLKSIKRRAMIPANQSTFKDEDFLAFADEEMNMGLVPSVMQAHEDYFLRMEEIPLIAGQTKYQVPYRAIGNKLRDVAYIDASGNVWEMTRIGVGDLSDWNSRADIGRAYAFYMANNEITLVPADIANAAGTKLLISYYMRPNTLVALSAVAPITSIDRTTGVLTVSNLPTDFTQSDLYDLVQIKSPHKTLNYDLQVVAINSTSKTITLTSVPDELDVGDHVCLATEAAIPQIPSDLHVMLAHRVAARVLEAIGDTEGLQNANQKLAEMEVKAQMLIDNRVEDAPKKITNRNGNLRMGLASRRFNRIGRN